MASAAPPSTVPTLGVEEELLAVGDDGRPARGGAAVSARAADELDDGSVQRELTTSQVETATAVCHDLADVRRALAAERATLGQAAREEGLRMLAVGAPPLGGEVEITALPRYAWMAEHYGALVDQAGTCGCHVHVGIGETEADRDRAARALGHLRPWLPVLLALSANSPYAAGRDTGHASWRTVLWGRFPQTAPPPVVASAAEYDERMQAMLATGAVRDEAMLYLWARLSAANPTLEVRAPDIGLSVDDAVLVAALTRALVTTSLAAADEPVPDVPDTLLRLAWWRAAHDGAEGALVDPVQGRPQAAADVAGRLLDHVRPALETAGDREEVEALSEQVLRGGTGAARQRAAYARRGSMDDVLALVEVP